LAPEGNTVPYLLKLVGDELCNLLALETS